MRDKYNNMFSENIPKKGISLFLITVISSFAVIIYLYAWDYQNKMNEIVIISHHGYKKVAFTYVHYTKISKKFF